MRRCHRPTMRDRSIWSAALVVALGLVACTGGQPEGAAPNSSTSAAGTPTGATTSPAAPTTAPADPSETETATAEAPAEDQSLTIAFVGDVMLARSIGDRIETEGPDVVWAGLGGELTSPDLTVANLETAVGPADIGAAEPKAFTFLAPPSAAEALTVGGIDLVSLANNHTYDFGEAGIISTLEALEDAGIEYAGAGRDEAEAHRPAIVEQDGMRVAFLSYVALPDDWNGYRNQDWTATQSRPGVAWMHPERVADDVAAAAADADHVVVLMHAGWEGSTEIHDDQRQAADAAFDSGATAVIGAHPHVLQGYRHEDGRLVAWSLGNFVFDGFTDVESNDSAILTVTLEPVGVTEVQWSPVVIRDGLPESVDPESTDGARILDRLETLPDR